MNAYNVLRLMSVSASIPVSTRAHACVRAEANVATPVLAGIEVVPTSPSNDTSTRQGAAR